MIGVFSLAYNSFKLVGACVGLIAVVIVFRVNSITIRR